MRQEFDRNAELLRHCRAELHGHPAILPGRIVLDCIKWGRRGCARDGNTQFASGGKLIHDVGLAWHHEGQRYGCKTDTYAIDDCHRIDFTPLRDGAPRRALQYCYYVACDCIAALTLAGV